jgi:hypothetical protein
LEKYAREAGVDMKDIIVVCAKNDFPNYGGSYSNGPLDGWNCVYIEANIDENISLINPMEHL